MSHSRDKQGKQKKKPKGGKAESETPIRQSIPFREPTRVTGKKKRKRAE